MPSAAIASRPATRATALFTPDAVPACAWSTAFITVVVRGAAVSASPMPSTKAAGKTVVQYDPPAPGIAKSTYPTPVIPGPKTSGRFDPYFATSPPDHRDSRNINRITG